MQEFIGHKVLITTASFFRGKDGNQYNAVHGTLKNVHEAKDVFGFTPNRHHANWIIEIGSMLIMGCQVLYCERVDQISSTCENWDCNKDTEYKVVEYQHKNHTYITD